MDAYTTGKVVRIRIAEAHRDAEHARRNRLVAPVKGEHTMFRRWVLNALTWPSGRPSPAR